MRTHVLRLLRRATTVAVATATLTAVLARPAVLHAAPADLLFSEYIEGSSNNKALEIYNGTGASINLGTGGYNVQMFFNGSATGGLTINLVGTVAAGDVFVLAQSSANAAILAQADQTNGAGWFNGDDAVVLRKGTTVIDSLGQVGSDPGTEWGSGLTSTADNTLRRKPGICVGDADPSNAFDPTAEWEGFATDNADGLGAHTATCQSDAAPQVTSSIPANGATDFPLSADLSVTFSEPVNAADGAFTLMCASTPVPLGVSGGPTTFTLHPATSLPAAVSCTLTVVKTLISDQDAIDPPDTLVLDFTTQFTPLDACQAPFTKIPSIQGSGASAAIVGDVMTKGVVTGDFEGASGIGGFYMQDPAGDGNPATSDGIFVYTGAADTASVGDLVWVHGYARERFNQTTINGANSNDAAVSPVNVVKCGTGSISAIDLLLPFSTLDAPEPLEGMLVRLPQPLVISEYFNYERFGELVLGLPRDGEPRLMTPTVVEAPGAAAVARAADNALREITLDDGLDTQNPEVVRHPDGQPFSLDNRFRGGDVVQNVVGVLGFDFDVYRIQPTGPATYVASNPRPEHPSEVGGSLRVASMNTLNFFLTPDYPSSSDPRDNKCGPSQNMECRGWDADQPTEFPRQRTKLIAALAALDADVIGVNEIENTPGVEPLGDPTNGVVAGLNALGGDTFAFIDTGVVGTDAIRVGLIYKPSRVIPVGHFASLTTAVDPRFIDTKSRPSLAQTFEVAATGARFTVVVNHLKSKGSDCEDVQDPDTGDGQGNCNLTRTAAAEALMDWIATDPTGSGDADVLVVGDLNSYAKENPVTAIRNGADDAAGTIDDFTNLVAKYEGPYAYSYVFDAQAGYLDHALGSPSLTKQATGATEFHINADEPDLLDYDTSFKPPAQQAIFEANAYRTSDHDPVVVGLNPLRFAFTGFHKLVSDGPTFNGANAGSSIPLIFGLGGDRGAEVFADGYPRSTAIACDARAIPVDAGLETESPGGSQLSFDPLTNQYTYVWKTERAWRGTCRRLVVVLRDGAVHTVNVAFK